MELIGPRDPNRDNVFIVRDPKKRCERLCKVYLDVRGDQTLDEYAEELAIIKDLKHPRLTQVDEIRKSNDGFAIFYANYAATLKELIQQRQRVENEEEAAVYFRQVLEVIKYCHDENVAIGGNIMSANFVFDTKSDTTIRLDVLNKPHFVSGDDFLADTRQSEYHPAYLPPEAIPELWDAYDPVRADSWCAGILLYELVTGTYPFQDTDHERQIKRICHQRVPMPTFLSESLKSLLHMLLNKKWEERLTVEDALYHPWIKSVSRNPEKKIETLFS